MPTCRLRCATSTFNSNRAIFLYTLPATFCSLGQAHPSEVCSLLRSQGEHQLSNMAPQEVFKKLMLRTNMHQLLGESGNATSTTELAGRL